MMSISKVISSKNIHLNKHSSRPFTNNNKRRSGIWYATPFEPLSGSMCATRQFHWVCVCDFGVFTLYPTLSISRFNQPRNYFLKRKMSMKIRLITGCFDWSSVFVSREVLLVLTASLTPSQLSLPTAALIHWSSWRILKLITVDVRDFSNA